METIKEAFEKLKVAEPRIKRVEYIPNDPIESFALWLDIARSRISKEPILHNDMKEIYRSLISWAHGYNSNYLLKTNGICLAGPTGTGKTACFQILQTYLEIYDFKYLRNGKAITLKFHIFNSKNIESDFAIAGFEGIQKYLTYANICIDDLGAENGHVIHFGNRVNVIEQIIEERYSKGFMTHLSTNLKFDNILEKYGDRVYSRLHEMVSYVELKGIDFRINK